MRKSKLSLTSLIVLVVLLFTVQTAFAQTPPCSNKWFEVRPGSIIAGPLVSPGMHKIWLGRKDPQKGTISQWKSFGPFQVVTETKYLAIAQLSGSVTNLLANDSAVGSYPNPAGNVAAIYYQNKVSDGAWYAFCTQLTRPRGRP